MSACSEETISPGVWSARILLVTLCGMITKQLTSPPPPRCRRPQTELQCTWTILLAVCPSTESPLAHSSTSTPSTLRSLNLFILDLGSGLTSPAPQCLCVLFQSRMVE